MVLSPMRYKNFVWPHNPRVYSIDFTRHVAAKKVPFGDYILQDLGLGHRVLRGEGEFVGSDAYDTFKALTTVFYDGTPGLLVHPLWQESSAYFVELRLEQEPTEDYVKYSFAFWEDYAQYARTAKLLTGENAISAPIGGGGGSTSGNGGEVWYTVKAGDCLWFIARDNGTTVEAIVALNPQLRNPNIIYPGDRLRIF